MDTICCCHRGKMKGNSKKTKDAPEKKKFFSAFRNCGNATRTILFLLFSYFSLVLFLYMAGSLCKWLANCRCCIPTNAQGNATWKQYNSFLSTVCLSLSVSFSPSLFARKSVMGNCGGHTSVCRRRRRRRGPIARRNGIWQILFWIVLEKLTAWLHFWYCITYATI